MKEARPPNELSSLSHTHIQTKKNTKTQMLKYAREDTHYLLYVHDCLKRDIATGCHSNAGETRACLQAALDGGRELCLLRYRKDGQWPSGFSV